LAVAGLHTHKYVNTVWTRLRSQLLQNAASPAAICPAAATSLVVLEVEGCEGIAIATVELVLELNLCSAAERSMQTG
jgi:hypothetical protein